MTYSERRTERFPAVFISTSMSMFEISFHQLLQRLPSIVLRAFESRLDLVSSNNARCSEVNLFSMTLGLMIREYSFFFLVSPIVTGHGIPRIWYTSDHVLRFQSCISFSLSNVSSLFVNVPFLWWSYNPVGLKSREIVVEMTRCTDRFRSLRRTWSFVNELR